jgi:hypothetical protein
MRKVSTPAASDLMNVTAVCIFIIYMEEVDKMVLKSHFSYLKIDLLTQNHHTFSQPSRQHIGVFEHIRSITCLSSPQEQTGHCGNEAIAARLLFENAWHFSDTSREIEAFVKI